MLGIGRYLLLFISLSGLSLSVDGRFSAIDKNNFLAYIFRLHNAVRVKHGVSKLLRTNEMDAIASQNLSEFMYNKKEYTNQLGILVHSMNFDDSTQLNVQEAMKLFAMSYDQGNFYNYETHNNPFPTENFTQIVWGDTTQIGLTSTIVGDEYKVITIYYPCGNERDQYQSNVLPPQDNLPANDRNIPEIIYKTGKELFLDKLLELHNEKRRMHGVHDLIRDVRLDDVARSMSTWETIGPTEEYGVNFFLFWNIMYPLVSYLANNVFSEWYNKRKIRKYNNTDITFNNKYDLPSNYTDSFTQIVWRNTRRIGLHVQMRITVGLNGEPFFPGLYQVIVVYEPPGNIPGEFSSNVDISRVTEQGESSRNN